MRFAYADSPYLGMCGSYEHFHGDGSFPFDGGCWDDAATHERLIGWLCEEFPDGWAMSLSTPTLRTLLPLCPDDCRTLAWVKPWCSFKPGVGVAFAWEPVIVRGGRKRERTQRTVRDWHAENITMGRGFFGAKPSSVIHWICDVLNVQQGDEVVDVFAGSGACQLAIDGYLGGIPTTPESLFGEAS